MRRFLGDAVLLFAGVGLGIATLFKNFYPGKPSLAGINSTLVFNLINFAGWTAGAVLLLVKEPPALKHQGILTEEAFTAQKARSWASSGKA